MTLSVSYFWRLIWVLWRLNLIFYMGLMTQKNNLGSLPQNSYRMTFGACAGNILHPMYKKCMPQRPQLTTCMAFINNKGKV